jgi:DNA-directed RNA polymerase specialized sigma24 family protein
MGTAQPSVAGPDSRAVLPGQRPGDHAGEAVLTAGVRSGDIEAAATLYRMHGPDALAFARILSRSEHDAEDVLDSQDHQRVLAALQSLPKRWQTVLWYTDVLQEKPRNIAPLMGIAPNAVSALVLRARKGLREAYLNRGDRTEVDAMDPAIGGTRS